MMTKQEFIKAIEASYECEALDEREGFQMFFDAPFFGDFIITINQNNTLDISINVFDMHYDMHSGFEKAPAVWTLEYYKIILSVLEKEFGATYELIESQCLDNHRGSVYIAPPTKHPTTQAA